MYRQIARMPTDQAGRYRTINPIFLDTYRARWISLEHLGRGNGAQGRNRTTDTAIFNRMLYQLSYLGARRPSREGRPAESGRYRGLDRTCPEGRSTA